MKRLRSRMEDSEIPTASMADIAFLLIIFFMVTAVFSATKGLQLGLSEEEDDRGKPEPDPGVLVQIHEDGMHVDCRPMELAGLLPYLEPRLTRNPTKPVILVPDKDASYRRVVEVYDTLLLGDTANISFPTSSEIESYVATFGHDPFEARCAE
jgi:biopolymer transport protein ExbD